MFTAAQVKAVIDAAIVKAEATAPQKWEKVGLEVVRVTIDSSPLPALIAEELNLLIASGKLG